MIQGLSPRPRFKNGRGPLPDGSRVGGRPEKMFDRVGISDLSTRSGNSEQALDGNILQPCQAALSFSRPKRYPTIRC
jgi:hypothetical protein